MAKVRLVAPRTLVDRVTSTLQETGVLHIESAPMEAARIPLRPQVMNESVRQRRAELERLQEDVRRLLLLLPDISSNERISTEQARHPDLTEGAIKQLDHSVREIAARVDDLSARLKACEEELALLSKYEKALAGLAPFLRFIQESEELDHLGVTLDEREGSPDLLRLLREMMAKITDNGYELFHTRIDARSLVVLLVFSKVHSARVRNLLWEEGIAELRLPVSVSDKPLGEAVRMLLQQKTELPLEAHRYRGELREVALQRRQELAEYHDAIVRCLERIEASLYFYQTEMATLIYGWVPCRMLTGLRLRIGDEFGGKVVLEECPVAPQEWAVVPVALRNPAFLQPFETLTRVVSLPRYGSIDPTPYVATFFPLFYGVILGDVGYGLLLLVAAAMVRRRCRSHPLVRDLSTIFLWASGSAILFGLLFGELFGELGEYVGLRPVLNRMQSFLPLLYISIGIGTVHVVLGLALGAHSALRRGNRQVSLMKCGSMVLVLSFISLLASVAGLAPREWRSAEVVGLLCALVIIFISGRGRGVMELHNLVNVLSYLRLMGIGVASAALAFAANKLGGLVGNVFLGIVIAVTLHGINVIFGILSPTIQSLRLHYVEFFENFFAPGGRQYKPFRHLHPTLPVRG
ncbi:MAG: V-type ATPase 116kDa subunit family protein [Nitrospira sp.]|nr:V-type ATPase 116kDa subunit family protein [Nitrospira sp.]